MPHHTPVLVDEILDALALAPGATVIDGTMGDGGHAEAILTALGGKARYLGIDLDPTALATAKTRLAAFGDAVVLAQGSFREIADIAERNGIDRASGILLDLGIRSAEIEESGRGFTFRKDEPLIMRFDGRTDLETAADLVNRMRPPELRQLLREYGEEPNASRIADAIASARRRRRIETTQQLVDVIAEALPAAARHGRTHFATRTFQALRIAVNDELGAARAVIPEAVSLLAPGGTLAIVSFHSLEDRIVKESFRRLAKEGKGRILFKRPLTPSPKEVAENPRSRSAKLRAFRTIP